MPSPEKREEDLNSSFCYPQDNRFIQTRSPESRKPGWPGCRPCEEAAARLLRVAARRSLCRFLVLLCSSSSSSSISPSASQAQLAKSTAGAIFRLCGRGSQKLGHGGPKIGLVVWRGQVGNGKFWFLGLKIRPNSEKYNVGLATTLFHNCNISKNAIFLWEFLLHFINMLKIFQVYSSLLAQWLRQTLLR